MSDKRIIEYDTATELSDDDYIVLDSLTGGTSKILAKKLEPPKPTRITATYTQTITVKDTDSLDVLRQDLVVKAYYDGGVVETVTNYTLSGTLEVGTSTITASYKGFSDTFEVTVESSIVYLYKWDFTQSLTDEIQSATVTLSGGATFTQGVGVSISGGGHRIQFPTGIKLIQGRTYVVELNTSWTSGNRFIGSNSNSGFVYSNSKWLCNYIGVKSYRTTSSNADVFNGKILKMILTSPTDCKVYADNDLVYDGDSFLTDSDSTMNFNIGAGSSAYHYMTITGVRIYANQ